MEFIARSAEDLNAGLQPGVDAAQVEPYLGPFTNPALGDITLAMDGDRLMLDAGEFAAELRPQVDETGETAYLAYTPPLASLSFEFTEDAEGEPAIIMLSPPDNYTFTRQ